MPFPQTALPVILTFTVNLLFPRRIVPRLTRHPSFQVSACRQRAAGTLVTNTTPRCPGSGL